MSKRTITEDDTDNKKKMTIGDGRQFVSVIDLALSSRDIFNTHTHARTHAHTHTRTHTHTHTRRHTNAPKSKWDGSRM